ncbi:MAG TPA: O-antigen ligase family protein [Candidatus Limnocylindrales bacterium]|nr:O-antigen ligase family protein [Candidatus Limnocylindrales bacterium]
MDKATKQIKSIVFGVIALVPLVFVPIGLYGDYFYAPKVTALTILAAAFLYVLLVNRRSSGRLIKSDAVNFVLFLYFCLLVVSVFFARDRLLAFYGNIYREEGLRTILLYLLTFLAARAAGKVNDKFFVGVLATASVVAGYGVLQFYGIDPFPRDFIRTGWRVAFSTLGNPNFLGSYLVLMVPLAYHYYISKSKKAAMPVLALLFWCLLATQTRSAWLGSVGAAIAYFALSRMRRRCIEGAFKRSLEVLGLVIFLLIAFELQPDIHLFSRFATIPQETLEVLREGEGAAPGGSYRIFVWVRVLELIRMRPFFGHGIENMQIPFTELYMADMVKTFGTVMRVDRAHNEYLHIAVSAGIPALLLYLSFLGITLRRGFRRIGKVDMALPLLAASCGYLIQAFFNISVVSVAYVFWAFLGLLAGGVDEEEMTGK